MSLVTPKVGAKHELLFNELASAGCVVKQSTNDIKFKAGNTKG